MSTTPIEERSMQPADQLSTPLDFARSMTHPAVLTTSDERWMGVSLQRFNVPSFDINLAGSSAHRVTLHLGGSILIHRKRAATHDQRWSSVGCTNIVPARTPTTRSFNTAADFVVAYIDPILIDEVATEAFYGEPSRLELVESFAVEDNSIRHIVELLLLEAELRHTSRLLIDTFARALSLHLVRSYSSNPPKELLGVIKRTDPRLRRVIDYMNANISKDLPLGELAKVSCLSASHFTRLFRGAVGCSPHQYLLHIRIKKACEMLQHTSLPITEVAFRCGFEQPAYFSTTFRKICGQNPSTYRAERRGCAQREVKSPVA